MDFQPGNHGVRIMGYLNQGAAFGVAGDHYDTMDGFQSAIFQALLELEYLPRHDLKIFASGSLNVDWAYHRESSDWKDKGFDESRDRLHFFDKGRDLLKEFHVTWSPGDFIIRAGKQIVVWGETDGFRIMDQINPLDQRRGFTDVEFETTIIPLWLLRIEYYMQPLDWLQNFGIEFIFNPNADFRGNENIMPGNDYSGIWAPNIKIPLGGPAPHDFAYLGSFDIDIDQPDDWNPDGFEYGVRLKGVIQNAIVTLNYFYGLDNDPVVKTLSTPPRMEITPYDNRMVIHLPAEGFYPLFRFAGVTLSRDFERLYFSSLGGVAPVLRLEAFYGFSNSFVTTKNTFEKHDEIRWAMGIDWKIKIPLLNNRAYFMISPQFYHRKICDYPSDYGLVSGSALEDNNYQTSLMISTSYFNVKLLPSFFWLRDITNSSNFFRLQTVYEQDHHWNYTLGILFFKGTQTGLGFEPFNNKDQVYSTIGYRF